MINNISYLPGLGSSDHVCLNFNLICYVHRRGTALKKYNIYLTDFTMMRQTLETYNWDEALDQLNISEAWDYFYGVFNNLIGEYVPVSSSRNRKNIYITREVIKLKNTKNRLWRRYSSTGDPMDHAAFASTRNALRALTRKLRKTFEESITKNIKTNPKAFWKYSKSRLKTYSTINALINPDGNVVHGDALKVEIFNNFFTSVFTNENISSLPTFTLDTTVPILSDVDITPHMVLEKLRAIHAYKSPGPDGWPTKIIKECADTICTPLAKLYSKSLSSGSLPKDWKIAHIVPIFKKGNKQLASNYRPISLTSIIGKVMESIVKDAIMAHMSQYNLFSDSQHGFLPHKSCTTQLLTAMNHWTESLNSGYATDIIYFDFKKAFDLVPHRRLLLKLKSYGISGNLLSWLSSFLTGRLQRVTLNNVCSEWSNVISGVPQGSVLGPILFLLYVNDFPSVVDSHLLLFADDIKLYRRIQSENDIIQLQKDINNLLNWSNTWLLNFNIPKCKVLRIGTSTLPQNYTLNGTPLDNVQDMRLRCYY